MEKISIKDKTKCVLDEARMVLPGIQALFGFQLIAVFNNRFAELSTLAMTVHLIATGLTSLCVAFLMAPAIYHRHVEPDTVSEDLVRYTGKMICLGMAVLLLSMSLDFFVVVVLATRNVTASILCAIGVAFVPTWLWFVIPELSKTARRSSQNALNTDEPAAFHAEF